MGVLNVKDDVPTIPEFYKGKTIFITGGTGFMGKVLLEKLLYSCTELDRIYLLMRNKKGVKPDDRIQQIYSSACFDRLRKEKPGVFESKIFVIPGDVMENGLGISDEDRTLLINRVNIIFHVAACVRFDDPLKDAVSLNLKGTLKVVELAKEMRNLNVMVHVSTGYSNTNRNPIEEKMYPPLADWRDTIEVCEKADDYTLKILTPKYIGEMPNTYTFTKQLAEHIIYEQRGKLPIVIVRPSIVISSVEEPMPGWIENFNGPVGMMIASGMGIMRSLYTDPNLVSDYMPVDIAIKVIIVSAWERGVREQKPDDDIIIYNCCAGKVNYLTLGDIIEKGRVLAKDYPLENALWSVGGSLTTSKMLHFIRMIFLHILPAILVDLVLRVLGMKPMLVKLQRRIYIANIALGYYITREWNFNNHNILELRSVIKEQDNNAFYYEMENVDPDTFFRNAVLGGRRHLLKQPDESIPKAAKHAFRLKIIDLIVKCLFFGYLFKWIISSAIVKNLAYSVVDLLAI